MKKLLVVSLLFFSVNAMAQIKSSPSKMNDLKAEIIKMDSLLFTVAFNQCDVALFKKIIAGDIEF